MPVKTLSAKINEEVINLLNEICLKNNLVKAKIIEEALQEKLEEFAERHWAGDMLIKRAGSKSISLDEFKKKVKEINIK